MHEFFRKYKNKHVGETAYIIGSGPSVNDFVEQEKGVYIGGNNIIRNTTIRDRLGYLFFVYVGYEESYIADKIYSDMIDNLSEELPKFCCLNFDTRIDDPIYVRIKETVKNLNYYSVTSDPDARKLDITKEALWNYSIVFSMIQFALHSGFERIYLVGCDCTEGYFFEGSDVVYHYGPYIARWKSMKGYANMYYPRAKILSINPVNLSNVFDNIYTDDKYKKYMCVIDEYEEKVHNYVQHLIGRFGDGVYISPVCSDPMPPAWTRYKLVNQYLYITKHLEHFFIDMFCEEMSPSEDDKNQLVFNI